MKIYSYKATQYEGNTIITHETNSDKEKAGLEVAEIFNINPANLVLVRFQEKNDVGKPIQTFKDEIQFYKNKKFTQQETAQALGISLSTVHRKWK